ncbi:adenosine deaminase [Binucleata daphniae]
MILKRLKTDEEELEILFTEYIAILVEEKHVYKYVKQATELFTLPKYLKRVKTVDSKKYVLLYKKSDAEALSFVHNYDINLLKSFHVPNVFPITKKQYELANQAWPCYFYPYKEKKIETKYLQKHLSLLQNHKIESTSCCSSMCIIFDNNKVLAVENDTQHIFLHAVFTAIEKVSTMKYGYLCTDLEAIVYTEPCIACTMALTHGRIKRVYYLNCNIQNPTFTKLKLCYNKSLNHRYEVYYVNTNSYS